MGPFKFLSTIFASFAMFITKSLKAGENIADTVNVWAETAKDASVISSKQMLEEMTFENQNRNEELKLRVEAHKRKLAEVS